MSITVDDALRVFSPPLPLVVAYSGGADSTALLLACAEKWPGQVSAWHVHHGLQAAADDFASHCETVCAQLQVPLRVTRVMAGHAQGESPEDAARTARYEAFRALALVERGQTAIKSIA
ncbi:MAG: tRNA(Ile)-lysidine synthetase, partial [Pseudomonadota bacterium]|nr:tRNA(Ile)-lysidine synthetase [Pseudomonadota bacterium]